MSTTSQQINWIAGLLEGEGWFGIDAGYRISVQMSDLDTIEKFRILTRITSTKVTVVPRDGGKTQYSTTITGSLAIQWMMTLYPLMSIRRKERIRGIIEKWKIGDYVREKSRANRERGKKLQAIKSIAISRNISMAEAEKFLDNLLGKTVQ